MKANWASNETTIHSVGDLDAVVLEIRRTGQPTMLFLQAGNGMVLVVGIGHEESVLTFAEPNGTSFHSYGDPDRKGFFVFLCRDQLDEFMKEMAVPESTALLAAQQFIDTGERPPSVRWEPDW